MKTKHELINEMKLEFRSRSENESLARAAVSAFLLPLDPTTEELTEIKTSVSEAVSNAIIHGYGNWCDGIVCVECKLVKERQVVIIITDQGRGIENVEMAREPLFTTGDVDERSGMGFTVMESFMDKIEVQSTPLAGTEVVMYKTLEGKRE